MRSETLIDIDMNSHVRIHLSDQGKEILRRRHNQFEQMLPVTLRKAFDIRTDADGYVEMPLSEAMAAFGPFLATDQSPIGSTIQLVQKCHETTEEPRHLLPFFGKK